jgi:hypothetical protein
LDNYAAPEWPAIGIALGFIFIAGFLKGIKQTLKIIKRTQGIKKLLIMPVFILLLLFDIFSGVLGSIILLGGISSFTYNSAYILPTMLGFGLGLFLLSFIIKYLSNRQIFSKMIILIIIFGISLFLILIARQLYYMLNVSSIFLRSFTASTIAGMILNYFHYLRAKKESSVKKVP